MIVRAPARRAPAMAASPTPPQPNTATVSPCWTLPVYIAAPRPAITPQPIRPAASGRARGSTGTHCPAATSVFSAKAPMPSAGDRATPPSVIFCVAFCEAKQYHGRPRRQERQVPHGARQARIDVVARRDVGHAVADRLHHARRLVAEQEGELVVDRALAVVEVGVADPARLHLHQGLPGAGVGHLDDLDPDRLVLLHGHDGPHFTRHGRTVAARRRATRSSSHGSGGRFGGGRAGPVGVDPRMCKRPLNGGRPTIPDCGVRLQPR